MKKFIRQSIILFLVCLSLFLLLKWSVRGIEKKTYNSAFVDKLKMLKHDNAKRKLVLLGGSSVALGFSAALIEQETDIRSINLGHNLGFGLLDYQPFLLQQLNKEDIVVFAPEWNFYTTPDFSDDADLGNLILHNPDYGRLIGNKRHVLRSYFSMINVGMVGNDESSTAFRYHCINGNGDVITHCTLPPKPITTYEIGIDSLMVSQFRTYFPYFGTNRTLVVFPPTSKRIYNKYKAHLQQIETTLRARGFEVVDHIEDNVYEERDFFDTEYHLTCPARDRRTAKLVLYIRNKLVK